MATATNVVVGAATVFIAPAGTSAPTLPTAHGASTFATPTTPWVQVGFTTDGATLNVDRKTNEIRVEEQSTPVLVTTESLDVTLDLTFSEDVLANAQYAYGGGTLTTVAAASGVPGSTTLALSETLTQLAVVLLGGNAAFPNANSRMVYIPTLISAGKVKTSYKRAKEARLYPATFTAVCAPSTISIVDVTAAAV